MIKIIPSNTSNRTKWEQLVALQADASVYENAWYLDAFCTWDILAREDFSGAMALPYTSIWGFKRYYQPPFIQQCRWIGSRPSTDEMSALSDLLRRGNAEVHINTNLQLPDFEQITRTNLVLPLAAEAHTLYKEFGKDLQKNIKRYESRVSVTTIDRPSQAVDLYRRAYGDLNPQIRAMHYMQVNEIIAKAVLEDRAVVLLATDAQADKEVLASAVFLKGHGRLHYILGAPTEVGRKMNALSVLLWTLIKDYSGRGFTLDFEGSSIPAVANYYKRFGAKNQPFYELKRVNNRWYGLLKRLKQMI